MIPINKNSQYKARLLYSTEGIRRDPKHTISFRREIDKKKFTNPKIPKALQVWPAWLAHRMVDIAPDDVTLKASQTLSGRMRAHAKTNHAVNQSA